MTDTVQTPPPKVHVGSYTASLARGGAVLAAVIYGAGFVILAGHDAHYGIFEFDPLRARVFLVGFAFIVLCALPAAAKHYGLAYYEPLRPVVENKDPSLRVQREIVLAAGFVFTAAAIAAPFSFYLFSSASSLTVNQSWWEGLALETGGAVVLLVAYARVVRIFVHHPTRAATYSILSSVAAIGLLYAARATAFANMIVWFSLISLLVLDVKSARDWLRYALDYRNLFSALMILVFYVVFLFGVVQPRFGGGALQPAVLYLNRPVAWLKTGPIAGSLVDETDQGFYVVLGQKQKALFLPRDEIAAVYFGKKADIPKASK